MSKPSYVPCFNKNANDNINDIEELIKDDSVINKNIITENDMINLLNNLIIFVNINEKELLAKNPYYNNQNMLGLLKLKFNKLLQKEFRKNRTQIKKTILLYYYRQFVGQDLIADNALLKLLLMKKPANHISGINQVTILTSATPDGQDFSCKHDCFYCPNEPAHEGNDWIPQPRSYLTLEPAVQRANRNGFDPFKQTKNRLDSLLTCGHTCDKLEFIIEGGTFTEYPKQYLKRFFAQFIYCVNTYFDKEPKRQILSLEEEILFNKTAKCKIIGICIETRPDAVLENDEDGIPWLKTLLIWGVTRIQIGVQHLDNYILKKINRGHTIEKAIEAIRVLKNNCFKIDIHIMPDLPYSNKEKDIAMFKELYSSPLYQPDQMKIYPCEIVPWTKIKKWHEEGKYTPYGENKQDIEDVLYYAMSNCLPWIRLPRVVRDIPDTYISGGMKCGNMRQVINDKMSSNKLSNITNTPSASMDIRFREIGRHPNYSINDACLFVRRYEASEGVEYFISYETIDKKAIFGFTRLRITNEYNDRVAFSETLQGMGLIRELHVYGNVETLRKDTETSYSNSIGTQHCGFGKKLIATAEIIAALYGKTGCVVISGIGVRNYYEKINYTLIDNYMVKKFSFVEKLTLIILGLYSYITSNCNIMF